MTKTMVITPGEVIAGKYRVDQMLGVGGMGAVVSATHLQLGHRVALKFMLPEALGNSDMVTRFLREARAAANLKSEHVTRVSDIGETEAGALYIVMEHLEGHDLEKLIQDRGPMSPSEAAGLVLQACDAIREAHAAGIVHRDLKPANLFLTKRANGTPLVKVLDFGISKVKSQTDAPSAMTHTNAMIGSPYYMSPEQMVSSRDVDATTDIWAIGVILYQLVSGRVPFQAESIGGLVLKVHNEKAPALPALHLMNAPEFCALVARCMERDRSRRPTIDELVLELTRLRDSQAASSNDSLARTAAAPAPPATPSATSPLAHSRESAASPPGVVVVPGPAATGASWGATAPGRVATPPSRAPIVGAAALVLVACAAGLLFFITRGRPGAPASPASNAAVSPTAAPPPAAPPSSPPLTTPSSAPSAPSAAPDTVVQPPAATAVASGTTPPEASASSKPAPRRGHAQTPGATSPSHPVAPASTTGSAFDR